VARDHFDRIKGDARPLDELLVGLAQAHGLGEVMRAHRLVIEWHGLVGPTIARSPPRRPAQGRAVGVGQDSPWMHQPA
jgi:hypothetical protein